MAYGSCTNNTEVSCDARFVCTRVWTRSVRRALVVLIVGYDIMLVPFRVCLPFMMRVCKFFAGVRPGDMFVERRSFHSGTTKSALSACTQRQSQRARGGHKRRSTG